MAFDERSVRILDQLRQYLSSIVDEHARTTVAAWVRAWDDLAPELSAALDELAIAAGDGRITRSQILRARRLNNALDLIETRLTGLVDGSGRHVIRQLREVVDNAGHATDQLISSQLPRQHQPAPAWSKVDPRQVNAIVERTTEQITKASFPLSGEATASIKRNLIRGMLTGSNPREVARRAVRQAEQGFNGGLTRALTIARTEMLDAHRAAAQLGEKAHTDVLTGWTWECSFGSRTCPACWGMSGTFHELDEPGPEGHQNCRCIRVPKTKSWNELGFNIDEPPSLLPDAKVAFDALGPVQQLHVLGPTKYQAWRGGRFPMEAWAQKKSNPGWRDSWVPSKAPLGPTGRNPIRRNRSGSGSGQPPRNTVPPVAPSPDPLPPIGKVLTANGGNHYVRPGQSGPVRPRGNNPDWEYEYIPDPADRMSGMLQYYFEPQDLVKAVARNIRAGLTPMQGVARLSAWGDLRATLKPGYKLADLRKDAIAGGSRLAASADEPLGTVFRGLAVDDDTSTLLTRYVKGWSEEWSFASGTKDALYAAGHARHLPGASKVLWVVTDAQGHIVRSVGRMASIDERLISGRVVVDQSFERTDGVVEVHARWEAL